MRLGIIGYGMVGKAVANGFITHDLLISDPNINSDMTLELVCNLAPDMIFVCVPTPTKHGKFDSSIIDNIISSINELYNGIVVIKSTVPPDVISDLYKTCKNIEIVYNPEFLSDNTSTQDFINPSLIVIGSNNETIANKIKNLYLSESNVSCTDDIIHITDLVTASLIKYGFNTFYATKIIFMNELYKIIIKSDTKTTWNDFKKIYGANQWIGKKHLDVPGHDGYFGFGGKCFPKDTEAFAEYASSIGEPFYILEKAIELNKKLRDE